MAITIDSYTLDKEYVDGDLLGEDDLDAALVDATDGAVQQYINNKIRLNLIQLASDIMPEDWTFNDDGVPSMTNSIYDKQTETLTYDAGDIDIDPNTTDLDFVVVDAANASITMTPEHIGKYKVTCQFNHRLVGINAGVGDVAAEVRFRISDGTTASPTAKVHWMETSSGAGDPRTNIVPITLTVLIDVLSTATDLTVYLYKKNDTLSDITENDVCASTGNGQIYFLIEKV